MKALCFRNAMLDLVEDHPPPTVAPGEVLVRVSLAGICNTDLEIVKGYMGFEGVLGHEFVGVVEEAENGELVGKRVVGEINCPPPDCPHEIARHCPDRTVLGIQNRDGAFAELLALPEGNLHVVPDEVADEQAVFVEPLAAAFEILEQVTMQPSDRVAVLGDGKLGLLVVQAVATTGCKPLLIGRHVSKLTVAYDLGFTTTSTLCNDESGFDFVVDCTGSAEGFDLACELTRPRGTVILKSTVAGGAELNLARVVIDELTVVGSRCGLFPPALEALRTGQVQVEPLIGARYPFAQAIEAFDKARERGMLKVLLDLS